MDDHPHLSLVSSADTARPTAPAGPTPEEAARAADARAAEAFRAGDHARMEAELWQAERAANASRNNAILLRYSVRAEFMSPNPLRRRLVANLAKGASWAELLALHAPDLLASRESNLSGKTERAAVGWWNRSLTIGLAAGVIVYVILVAALPGQHHGTAVMALPQRLVATALLILREVLVDPALDAWRVTMAFLPILAPFVSLFRTPAGLGAMCVVAAGLAIQAGKALRMHAQPRLRPGELTVFVGRRCPLSYLRPIVGVPASLLMAAIAEDLGIPFLAMAANLFAFAGACEFGYRLLVPLSRPVLLITELPGEPRQARVEVFGGLFRVTHFVVDIFELRAASVLRSAWCVPTADIALRMVDGSTVRLEGFVTPSAARPLIGEINRLIRDMPPLPFPAGFHQGSHRH